ncbi:MAG: aminotransferase class I/II-fold pyridoxal phosphate-dependent enzyme [Clostridia bacterium]|nr:aminotransferase class I/II-fold pyridoxal phosphate-dependent enzyme [Clostridia bacterium]
MDIFEKCRNFTRAKDAMAAGIYPYFHALESKQDTEVIMGGKKTIMLGSNNYLGLTSNPRCIEAAKKALDQYGTGCSGSRFLNGTLVLHLELEKQLAEFVHKDSALTFSTGFQTNLGIISSIVTKGDYILSDRENHASIVDGCRLSFAKTLKFRHNDMEDLECLLSKIPEENGILIISDGVFSMGGEICNLPKLVELKKKYGARLLIDDAHAFGMIGEGGRGTASYFGLEDEVDIIMSTFSKSLASLGGFIAASEQVIHYVKHFSRPFIFSASIPPANAAVALEALNILKEHPEIVRNLQDNADYMREGFKKRNILIGDSTTAVIPVMTYNTDRTFIITKMLLEAGVYVNPVIAPAVQEGECLLRTSYTATHTKDQLDRALDIFEKVFRQAEELGI